MKLKQEYIDFTTDIADFGTDGTPVKVTIYSTAKAGYDPYVFYLKAGGTISEPDFRANLPLLFFTAVRVMVSYPSASTTISTVSPVNPVSVIRRQSLMLP